DDAEVARERAAVLHLHESTDAVESRLSLDAADRADVAGDERRRLLAPPVDDDDVRRQACERVALQIGGAAGDLHAPLRPRSAGGFLSRLRRGLMRAAAGVDACHVGVVDALDVTLRKQPLPHLMRIDMRDLAAKEADREARHRGNAKWVRGSPPPSRRLRAG